MKNFLRSFAIIASATLMFGACADEDSEDVVDGGGVAAPTITNIQGGNQKAIVSWSVATGNDAVNSCQIKWVGETTGYSGTYNYVVEPGGDYSFMILPLYTSGGELVADTYAVTIQASVTITGDSSDIVESSVAVYQTDSYDGKLPTPTVVAVGDGVQITWSDVDADCDYVEVVYYDSYNAQIEVTTQNMAEGVTTTLDDVQLGRVIKYTAYLKPEGGYDYVALSGDYQLVTAIEGAQAGDVSVGKGRFIANFTMPADNFDSDVDYVVLAYGDQEVKLTKEEGLQVGDNEFEVTGVVAGVYNLSVYSVDKLGYPSASSGFAGEMTIYDDSTYADSLPVIRSVENIDGDVEITFSKFADDCIGIDVVYTTVIGKSTASLTQADIESDNRNLLILNGAVEGSEFYLHATYLPSYSIGDEQDKVVVSGKDSMAVPGVGLSLDMDGDGV